MSAFSRFIKKYVPVWVRVVLILTLASVIALIASVKFVSVADFLNGTVGEAVRIALSFFTYIFPFSVFEWLLILLLPAIALYIAFRIKKKKETHPLRTVFALVGVIGLICCSYVFTLGVGYHTCRLDERLGIEEDNDITEEKLFAVAEYLVGEINGLSEELGLSVGESYMGVSYNEMSRKLISAFDSFLSEYPIFTNFESRVKPVMLSGVMSDAGITGIYSFFTGESNINVDYPDYCLPFTAAHELAHQRGIARENEANFVAFLVCISSSDPYILYSGYLNMFEYVGSALYKTNKDAYRELLGRLNTGAVADMRAASAVTLAHKDSWLNKLNDFLNDTYLKANGTEGVVSYGYVVRLTVGYYSELLNI